MKEKKGTTIGTKTFHTKKREDFLFQKKQKKNQHFLISSRESKRVYKKKETHGLQKINYRWLNKEKDQS